MRRGGTPPASLLAPLPPSLAALLAGTEEAEGHAKAVAAYEAAVAALAKASKEVEAAQARDVEAERRAVAEQKPTPKRTAETAIERRHETERRLTVAHGLLTEAARSLLAAAGPVLDQAVTAAERGREEALDASEGLLAAVVEKLAVADGYEAERSWLTVLAEHGRVQPYRVAGRRASPAISEVENVLGSLRRMRERRRDLAAQAERERAFYAEQEAKGRAEEAALAAKKAKVEAET
jgi:hypothetical protein